MKYFIATGEDRRLDADTRRDLRGSFIELSDGVTHYELAGPDAGPVALLIGGLTIPLFYWDDVAAGLHARGVRTLTYSLYGRGYSDRVDACYDQTLFVRQVADLVQALDLVQPLHVVGTSMGALIAMAYLQCNATSIATLTLAGPAGMAPSKVSAPHRILRSDRVASFVARRFGRRLLEGHLGHNVRDPQRSAELVAMVLNAYRHQGSLYAYFDTLQHFPLTGRTDVFRRTGQAGHPILLLWGTDDQVTPITSLDDARALLRPEQCLVLDCGHMAAFEQPHEVADTIATFVAAHTERLDP